MEQEIEVDFADMETEKAVLSALEYDPETFNEMVNDDLMGRS